MLVVIAVPTAASIPRNVPACNGGNRKERCMGGEQERGSDAGEMKPFIYSSLESDELLPKELKNMTKTLLLSHKMQLCISD